MRLGGRAGAAAAVVVVAAWVVLFGAAPTRAAAATQAGLQFGPFGQVAVYRETPHPAHVALFVSGDGGWNLGVVDMARALAKHDTLVLGIDIRTYLHALRKSPGACVYPAGDLEGLSQFAQKTLGFPHYETPVLVGYSSGATLVYAALVEAPPNTFQGAISLGFCPTLPITKPFCRGYGLASQPAKLREGKHERAGVRFLPAEKLDAPWIALQGTIDKVCNAQATQAYVGKVPGAEIVLLPKVGHGYSVQRHWMPQFQAAFEKVLAHPSAVRRPEAAAVSDLPLVEVLANGGPERDVLGVMISGDGGWASLDRDVAHALARRGVPVVGLDSLRYFWKRRTPDEAGRALARVASHYLRAWHKKRLLLAGYSRGAEVLPFMAARLPKDLRRRVALVALIGPGRQVDFEFHVLEWFANPTVPTALPVRPEVEKLRGLRVLCMYGAEEKESLCPTLPPALAERVVLPGAHHFGGDYQALADRILASEARSEP